MSGSGCLGVFWRDTDDLGQDATDFRRGKELPLALAAIDSEVPHEILIGIAQDVVVFGAVFGEIQFGLLEDADKIGEPIYHRLPLAEFIRIVEIGEVAAGKAWVGVD